MVSINLQILENTFKSMQNTLNQLKILSEKQSAMNGIFKPHFFRLSNSSDLKKFNDILNLPGIFVTDEIQGQLGELVKFKNPTKKFSTTELNQAVADYLGKASITEYGLWVFYPWSNKLVHILDEEEFILLRTSRNQYKITPHEKEILVKKKIGVIGLSVGQSVSVTLAMERVCGELRLADFDVLELTNLNRIRTGVHNLGLPKVYSVAREIAEIDPFIKVICYPAGLTESNMDAFFLENGKLDLLVEESDGFDIKVLCRYKARELKVPVIMEASDRCMVDVERFDLEPNRSILHGLVDHLDLNTLKSLKTNEEKIPYMLDILGIDTASPRLKASMLEIEQSITTWPQLASAVTMGGGITADVSRRLLLNQYTDSGRYHVDIEKLICNKGTTQSKVIEPNEVEHQTIDLRALAQCAVNENKQEQMALSDEQVEALVSAACKAPSGGNAQPWRWIYKEKTLFLFRAFDSNSKFLGYGNLASYIGLGAAAENIILKAAEFKLEAKAIAFPDINNPSLTMLFEFYPLKQSVTELQARISAIEYRLTNRKLGKRESIESSLLQKVIKAAEETPKAKLTFFTDPIELDAIAEVLGELEKIRLLEKMGHLDFVEEVRWTKEENDLKRDGVDLRTLDITNSERVGLQLAKEADLIQMLHEWNGGGAFKKLTKKSVDSASAIGIITLPGNKKENFLEGGRVLQRAWLEANLLGLAFQPLSASVFLYARFLQGAGEGLSEQACKQMQDLRPVFEKTFAIESGYSEIFIFRLCKAAEPEIKALRKPLDQLFINTNPS